MHHARPHSTSSMSETMGRLAARAINAKMAEDGRPFVIGLFTTNRCNCQCKSCLWKNNSYTDTPLADLKRFYSEAKEQGFVATAFTGGEPFLRRDLGELARHVKLECDMPIVLFTTGWFLEKRMDEVLPYVDLLTISLDSASAARHDEIRGLPGLFDRALRAITLVQQRYPALPIQINCCVQRGIADEIDPLIALVSRLGLRISFDVITEFRNAGEEERYTETSMCLSPEQLKPICERLLQLKRDGAPILNSTLYFQYFVDGRPGYRCHLPKMVLFVDGRGYLEDCLALDTPIAHINDMPLAEIMELPRFKALRKDAERCSTCSSPTMVDMSHVWENPQLVFQPGGLSIG